jgi:hypothetical protein
MSGECPALWVFVGSNRPNVRAKHNSMRADKTKEKIAAFNAMLLAMQWTPPNRRESASL